jgi:hypothetical protein
MLTVKVEPSREHLLERVRVSFHDDVIGMTCLECTALEIVRVDPAQFDDEVRRFLRTHPSACRPDPNDSARHLTSVPPPRA